MDCCSKFQCSMHASSDLRVDFFGTTECFIMRASGRVEMDCWGKTELIWVPQAMLKWIAGEVSTAGACTLQVTLKCVAGTEFSALCARQHFRLMARWVWGMEKGVRDVSLVRCNGRKYATGASVTLHDPSFVSAFTF
eukprot:406019-Pelagomonas_calceolata.AAC.6